MITASPTPMGLIAASPLMGAMSTTTPAKPAMMPAITSSDGRRRVRSASSRFIQIGTAAIRTAATPESMYCSDCTTNPLPPNSSRPPMIAADRQCSLRIGSS